MSGHTKKNRIRNEDIRKGLTIGDMEIKMH